MGSTIDEPSAMPDFDQRLLSLCDEIWTAEARKHGALLYLAAFTGFGTEPAYETLNALRSIRADRDTIENLGLLSSVSPLIRHLEDSLGEPPGVTHFEDDEQ